MPLTCSFAARLQGFSMRHITLLSVVCDHSVTGRRWDLGLFFHGVCPSMASVLPWDSVTGRRWDLGLFFHGVCPLGLFFHGVCPSMASVLCGLLPGWSGSVKSTGAMMIGDGMRPEEKGPAVP
jgi:hypothetical protein